MKLVARLTREAYRREAMPARVRWWLAAAGMCDWYRVLAREMAPVVAPTNDARDLLATLSVRMFERRGEVLGVRDARDRTALMRALYRVHAHPKAAWIFGERSTPTLGARLRGRQLLARMSPLERWNEVTTHLGELLVVLTEDLPAHVPHARKVLADICFGAGKRFAERVKDAFSLDDAGGPADAIEVLRMSEYVFRVNPDHWSTADAKANTGSLEGTACPWYDRPGWNGAHCGIFGQFQAGISSVFGLRYHLAQTIPKHGGTTCRIELKPISPLSLVTRRP